MFITFSTFTNYFFYLFVCYHYAKYHYPEKTQTVLIFIGYNTLYLYSKLQILLNKKLTEGNNYLIKYKEYQNFVSFLYKISVDFVLLKERVLSYIPSKATPQSGKIHRLNEVTIDFVLNNEVMFDFEKTEFLNDYLTDFFPNKKENTENTDEIIEKESTLHEIVDYDFIIINGNENLKKIIQRVDLNNNDLVSESSTIFKLEPFLYKPLLCEFSNKSCDNNDNKPIKIDFCDNNKFYDFLVIGNCFDKLFLTYFMKKYYDVDVKENFELKILDNNVNTLIIESSDTLTIDENSLVVNYKNK